MQIILDKVTYKYSPDTAFEHTALKDVSLKINEGEFIGIIGHSGSGKSTLAMHLNGLLKAFEGRIYFNGEDIYEKSYDLKSMRTMVGLVFQYPEYQLFETTVLKDVKFGPLNQGLNDKEATIRAYEALETLHFPRELFEQSPFDLSGGQKRLAAIAGVLAMKPAVMILDEPTAGLDPAGREALLGILKELHSQTRRTIILISHSMEDIAGCVDRLVVMNKGEIIADDVPQEIFIHGKRLEKLGLGIPQVTALMQELRTVGMDVPENIIREEDAVNAILLALRGRRNA